MKGNLATSMVCYDAELGIKVTVSKLAGARSELVVRIDDYSIENVR